MEIVYEYKKRFKGIEFEIGVLYDLKTKDYIVGIRNNGQLVLFFFNEDEFKDFLNSLNSFLKKRI